MTLYSKIKDTLLGSPYDPLVHRITMRALYGTLGVALLNLGAAITIFAFTSNEVCRDKDSKANLSPGRNYVATANLDKDDLRDIVIGDSNGKVYVLWNKGNNKFEKQKVGEVMRGETSITTGDRDNDNLEDIAVTDRKGCLHIFYNNGDRSFRR